MAENNKKSYKHIIIPLCLLIYLGIMAYIGREELQEQNGAIFYYGKIALGLLVLVMLHFVLKRKAKLRKQREEETDNSENTDQK